MHSPSLPNSPSILVGRDREIGLLRDHLDAALGGHGSLVLISGEAGMIKLKAAISFIRAMCCLLIGNFDGRAGA